MSASTTRTNADAYLKTKVMTASPAELRLMLFDGAIRFAQQSREALERKDFEATYNGATRCQSILMELLNSLKPEHDPALCERLTALYTYLYTTMVKGTSERDPAQITQVITLLKFERETWQMLIDQLAAENRAANSLDTTPDARPTTGGNFTNADALVGATVSVKG